MSRECGEGGPDGCMCPGGSLNLDILKDVQRAYEERLNAVERYGGPRKLQMQVDVMKSWVDDLVGQNSLLVQAIEDLETEATAKLLHERAKHSEIEGELSAELSALRRRLARKDSDLRGLIEVLRRLREFDYCTLEGIHFFEVTESDIFGSVEWRQSKLEQGDMKSGVKVKSPSTKSKNRARYKLDKKGKQCKELRNITDLSRVCSKRDVEVSVGICCSDRVELGGGEAPFSASLLEEAGQCREKIAKLETKLKSAGQNVCALRKVNVALGEELHALRRVCAALDEQCRASTLNAQFKDEIIREMRRQLKQAKAKLRDSEAMGKAQSDFEMKATNFSMSRSSRVVCVRQQPRRRVGALTAPPAVTGAPGSPAPDGPFVRLADSDECRTPRLDGSGDDIFSIRSS